jgi:hypothetical protein
MISIFRYWLSISLVLLQLVAPLIHAHKNENFEASFHLPEFEQISGLLENKSMMLVPATQGDQIVTVSAGMKNNKRRFLSDDDFKLLIVLPILIVSLLQNSIVQYFITAESINYFTPFNSNAPRAPPCLSYC